MRDLISSCFMCEKQKTNPMLTPRTFAKEFVGCWSPQRTNRRGSRQLFFDYVLKQPANYSSHRSVATFERDKSINMMLCKSSEVKDSGLERQAIC